MRGILETVTDRRSMYPSDGIDVDNMLITLGRRQSNLRISVELRYGAHRPCEKDMLGDINRHNNFAAGGKNKQTEVRTIR